MNLEFQRNYVWCTLQSLKGFTYLSLQNYAHYLLYQAEPRHLSRQIYYVMQDQSFVLSFFISNIWNKTALHNILYCQYIFFLLALIYIWLVVQSRELVVELPNQRNDGIAADMKLQSLPLLSSLKLSSWPDAREGLGQELQLKGKVQPAVLRTWKERCIWCLWPK